MKFKIIIAVIAAIVLVISAVFLGETSSNTSPQPGPVPQSQDAFKNFKIPN